MQPADSIRRFRRIRRVVVYFMGGAVLALALAAAVLLLGAWADAMGCVDPECILPLVEPATVARPVLTT